MGENSSSSGPFRLCDAEPVPARRATPTTYFAPAGRSPTTDLERQRKAMASDPLFQATIDCAAVGLAVLNSNRQIVAANTALLKTLGAEAAAVLGKRPGEALGCVQWKRGPDGCGTALGCAACGAVRSILESQRTGFQAKYECQLTRESAVGTGAMDLLVTASLITVEGEPFTICTIEDIADRNRLSLLMRTFFHDVLNEAGVLQGFTRLLAEGALRGEEREDCAARLSVLADQLVEEIQAQRDLVCAEASELSPQFENVRPSVVVNTLCVAYSQHPVGSDRALVAGDLWRGELVTDPRLLRRVLGNMLKNALEATPRGGTVTIGCEERDDRVAFSVHNASAMPEEVKPRVFQRSFSTKAEQGRGIGTYSMKLLGERYLGGKVDFTSDPEQGTIFTLALPKRPESADEPTA